MANSETPGEDMVFTMDGDQLLTILRANPGKLIFISDMEGNLTPIGGIAVGKSLIADVPEFLVVVPAGVAIADDVPIGDAEKELAALAALDLEEEKPRG